MTKAFESIEQGLQEAIDVAQLRHSLGQHKWNLPPNFALVSARCFIENAVIVHHMVQL